MLKNNKIFITLLLVVFLLFTFCTFSFGSVSYDYNDTTLEFADFPFDPNEPNTYWVLVDGRYGYTVAFYKGYDFEQFVYQNGVLSCYNSSGNKINDGSVKISDYNTDTKSWGNVKNWGDLTGGIYGFISANVNVYDSFNGDVFFRLAPLGQLGEIVETTEPQEVMSEILGILPLILVVVVSLVGLRKALSMLFKLLRQS